MKATEQYFPVVLFTMLYRVDLAYESGYKIPKVWPFKSKVERLFFPGVVVYYAVQASSR